MLAKAGLGIHGYLMWKTDAQQGATHLPQDLDLLWEWFECWLTYQVV